MAHHPIGWHTFFGGLARIVAFIVQMRCWYFVVVVVRGESSFLEAACVVAVCLWAIAILGFVSRLDCAHFSLLSVLLMTALFEGAVRGHADGFLTWRLALPLLHPLGQMIMPTDMRWHFQAQ